MRTLTYCKGPLKTGCPTSELIDSGETCASCESRVEDVLQQRRREAEQLRAQDWTLHAVIEMRPLWEHPAHGTKWHDEAVGLLGEKKK